MGIGELIVLSALCFCAVVALPIMFHFRGERRKRELEHIERMRAIDAGRPYPGENKFVLSVIPRWAVPHVIAASIGVVVPLGVFLFAFLASLIGGFQKDIWIAAGMVGLGGVICGTVLAGGACQKISSSGESAHSGSYLNSKPHVDEDAYDVVSSRG
jgi:hypothetical protein